MSTSCRFLNSTNESGSFLIPYNSIFDVKSTYQIPGSRVQKTLNCSFLFTSKDGKIDPDLQAYDKNGVYFCFADTTTFGFASSMALKPPKPITMDVFGSYDPKVTKNISKEHFDILKNKKHEVGSMDIEYSAFSKILDDNFYSKIRNIQNKGVVWRKCEVTVNLPLSEVKDGSILNSEHIITLKNRNFLSGDLCIGGFEDSNKVNKRAFTFDCYLKNDNDDSILGKPNRVLISGKIFSKKDEYIENKDVSDIQNVLTNGIEVFPKAFFLPIFKMGNSQRICKKAILEGISRTAGSGDSYSDQDLQNFEILDENTLYISFFLHIKKHVL